MAAEEKATAFQRTSRTDLNWIFTIQTERIVAKDNTVAIGARSWQIDKTRFRHTLSGCTVTIHEHLDRALAIRYGPHLMGGFEGSGERCGKVQSPPRPRPSPFPTADGAGPSPQTQKAGGSRRLKPKPDRSLITQTGHLD